MESSAAAVIQTAGAKRQDTEKSSLRDSLEQLSVTTDEPDAIDTSTLQLCLGLPLAIFVCVLIWLPAGLIMNRQPLLL